MAMGCGAVTSALTACGVISDEVYATVILGTIGAYIAGSTVQKVKAGEPTE